MRTKSVAVIGAGFGLLAAATPGATHHAFSLEFDSTKPVQLRGTITRMEWISPHSWIHLDVPQENGTVDSWMIEAGPAGVLVRRGWSRESIRPGTEIIVEGYQARDGSRRANGRDVTLPDGRRLFAGSSGPGAPPPENPGTTESPQ